VGCHEDGERTPENRFVEALKKPSVLLDLPPDKRRTVDFRRDVMPILSDKCTTCHGNGTIPWLDDGTARHAFQELVRSGQVDPGRARTSPLVWRIRGRNTARPWDADQAHDPPQTLPPDCAEALTEDERRTIVEWIDLGALWDGIPDESEPARGGAK